MGGSDRCVIGESVGGTNNGVCVWSLSGREFLPIVCQISTAMTDDILCNLSDAEVENRKYHSTKVSSALLGIFKSEKIGK